MLARSAFFTGLHYSVHLAPGLTPGRLKEREEERYIGKNEVYLTSPEPSKNCHILLVSLPSPVNGGIFM